LRRNENYEKSRHAKRQQMALIPVEFDNNLNGISVAGPQTPQGANATNFYFVASEAT
jgi:hypothetical protein